MPTVPELRIVEHWLDGEDAFETQKRVIHPRLGYKSRQVRVSKGKGK